MRRSDQENTSSNLTLTTTATAGLGAVSQRRFAGHKISKVRFLSDQSEFTGRFVSGTWNAAAQQGCLTLWQADNGGENGNNINSSTRHARGKPGGDGGGAFQRKHRLNVGMGVDVNDIFIINNQQFVASMSNGDVKIVDCPTADAANGDDNNDGSTTGGGSNDNKMSAMVTYPHVHKQGLSSTALCVLDNEIYSGSNSGQIVRILPASRVSHAVHVFAEDLMGVTELRSSGQFLMISAHNTGQIHLWDVRKKAINPEFGIEPLNSRAVTSLNNSITALAVHPAQHNVIGFGTRDGVISFVDIRQTDQPLPIAFKVSQEPINELKFHPIFANNCFSLSESGIVHWDGSVLARELNPIAYSARKDAHATNGAGSSTNDYELEMMAASMEMEQAAVEDESSERHNIWLSARASTSMQLRVLVEEEPRLLSSFDIVQGALVAGSHTAELVLLNGVNFGN